VPIISPEQLAREVHGQATRLVIAVTGGGSGAISALLGVAGASRTILAGVVPYAPQALSEWLGGTPDEFCSASTARAMAMAAFLKARQYDPAAATCGVACTASLASDRPKRGPHRAHFAYQTAGVTAALSLNLEKGRRDRTQEESLVAAVLLNHVAEACGVAARLALPLAEGEHVETTRIVAPQAPQDLLAGRAESVPMGTAGQQPRIVFPGAFHPLHVGHERIAAVARQMLGDDVAYEISIENVDKPPLDFIDIDERLRQFAPTDAVWLTRAARFADKARLFPGSTFVVGADTIARVGQPRYYGGQQAAMQAAIAEIVARGCRFLVFGRAVDGVFRTLADLRLPDTLACICREVPEREFRQDISSTDLRSQSRE
jgi:nicotinamide mononucleotide (NMN) deamidase PncC